MSPEAERLLCDTRLVCCTIDRSCEDSKFRQDPRDIGNGSAAAGWFDERSDGRQAQGRGERGGRDRDEERNEMRTTKITLIRCRCWRISKCEADQDDRPAMIKQSLARTSVMDEDGLMSLLPRLPHNNR